MGVEPAFTPARFSTGTAEERAITTSSGPFVITWPLKKVLAGQIFSYQIKRYPEPVIADSFRYGAEKSLIVALPHDVTVEEKLQAASARTLVDRGAITATRNAFITKRV